MEAQGRKNNYQKHSGLEETDEASYGNNSEIEAQFTLKFHMFKCK
jgi:hypothetical protein